MKYFPINAAPHAAPRRRSSLAGCRLHHIVEIISYLSGSQKRKIKEQKVTELSKYPKLTRFFQSKAVEVGESSKEMTGSKG